MKNMMGNYDKYKEMLITILEELKQSKFIPCNFGNLSYDESYIDDLKKSLIDEEFILSICGQIKAGKSTFLNNILFQGRAILPSDDVPCTAKLAKISYGEEDSAKIIFYTNEEWNKLKTLIVKENVNDVEINYFEKYLRKYVEKAAENGVYDKEVIHEDRLIKYTNNLENLEEYVSKDGLYTPFVSHVELQTKNFFIKNVIIVDTPGINDPNEYRSRITEQWISKSTAVLMLMYAGKPMERSDYDFIDKHLATVPSNKIIFALSKIDLILGQHESVKKYVENTLRTDKNLKERRLLENKEVYPTSTMAAIISYKENNSIHLTEEEEFYKGKMPLELIEREGYIPELYAGIEKHIMKNKGVAFLNKIKVAINAIGEGKIHEITQELELLEHRKENVKLSTDEIALKDKDIEMVRNNILEADEYFGDTKNKIITKILNETKQEIDKAQIEILEEYSKWLDSNDSSVDDVIKQTTIKIKTKFEEKIPKILDKVVTEDNSGNIKDFIFEYKRKMKEITKEQLSTRMEYIFEPVFDLYNIIEKVEESVLDGLASDILNTLREKVLGFLWTKKSETKNNVRIEVSNVIKNICKYIYNSIKGCIDIEFGKILKSIGNNISNCLSKLDLQLENHEIDGENYEGIISELKKKIEEKEAMLSYLKNEFENIKIKLRGGINYNE